MKITSNQGICNRCKWRDAHMDAVINFLFLVQSCSNGKTSLFFTVPRSNWPSLSKRASVTLYLRPSPHSQYKHSMIQSVSDLIENEAAAAGLPVASGTHLP
jgi:hypothetical protein